VVTLMSGAEQQDYSAGKHQLLELYRSGMFAVEEYRMQVARYQPCGDHSLSQTTPFGPGTYMSGRPTSLLDMCTASGGGPLVQLSPAFSLTACHPS